MKQLSLAKTGFLPKAGKQTRKVVFLAKMETAVPCPPPQGCSHRITVEGERSSADAAGHDVADSLHAAIVYFSTSLRVMHDAIADIFRRKPQSHRSLPQ